MGTGDQNQTRKSSCVKMQEAHRPRSILSMVCPAGEREYPVLVLYGGRGYPCPKTPFPAKGRGTRGHGPVIWGTPQPVNRQVPVKT